MNKAIKLTPLFSTLLFMVLFTIACGSDKDNPSGPADTDRDKFVGNWAGSYGGNCGFATEDTLIITKAAGDLEFAVTLHAQAVNADVVTGELTDANTISITGQDLGGFPGTAVIVYANSELTLSQGGLGISCEGTYQKY